MKMKEKIENQSILKLKKLNDSSMIGFFSSFYLRQSQTLKFDAYEISQQINKGVLHNFKIDLPFGYNYFDFLLATLKYIWQTSYDIFYIQCNVTVKRGKFYLDSTSKHRSVKESERYWSLYWNYQQNKISVSKFNPPRPHRVQFINCIREFQHKDHQQYLNFNDDKYLSGTRSEYSSLQQITVPIYYTLPNSSKILLLIKEEDRIFKIIHKITQ